ncbi:MAG: pilus assembly protein TadG-related protein [Mycobacteriales bacterium]
MSTGMCGRIPRGDGGSIIALIAVFVFIVVLFIMGMMTSTSAFLAQRNLQSECDSAALWVAAEADANDVLDNGTASAEYLPLSPELVASTLAEFMTRFHANGEPRLEMVSSTDGVVVTVRCHTRAKVPFGRAFGKGEGIDRDAWSAVRSPTAPGNQASIVPNDPRGEYGN